MPRKVLQVIESAYRCTIEEQDDPVVWITHAMKGAGANVHLLLRGNAVNYAVKGQAVAEVNFGTRHQRQAPRIDDDIASLCAKSVDVYVVEDDVAERGIERSELVSGIRTIPRSGIARLFGEYDQVWHW